MRRRTLRARALSLAAGLIVLLSACGSDGGESDVAGGGDPGLAHVHGLGVDPADGTLYAATHFGLFRVPERGEPTRVADRRQDTMGFTVAGPKHFLGSGHPGRGDDGPNPLGLIESTDAGENWQALSLSGESDFHALEFAHGHVYGYDAHSGRLLVSQDKKSWDSRAALPMADLAVSPESADTLVATTEQGLAASTDGGRTFSVIGGTPPLFFLSWPAPNALYGISVSGAVVMSPDGGKTWEERGSLAGRPAALTATDQDAVYAATETGIYASTDGGRAFTARYRAAG
jgi:hypothetical protein